MQIRTHAGTLTGSNTRFKSMPSTSSITITKVKQWRRRNDQKRNEKITATMATHGDDTHLNRHKKKRKIRILIQLDVPHLTARHCWHFATNMQHNTSRCSWQPPNSSREQSLTENETIFCWNLSVSDILNLDFLSIENQSSVEMERKFAVRLKSKWK